MGGALGAVVVSLGRYFTDSELDREPLVRVEGSALVAAAYEGHPFLLRARFSNLQLGEYS